MLSTFLFAHRRNTTAERRVPAEGTPVRLRVPVASLCFVIWLCFASYTLTAEPLDQWHRRNPLPTADRLYAVTFGNNTFVAVGDVDFFGNASILNSSDGVSWNPADSGAPGLLTAVTYGNGSFVAVGEAGLILTSSDAVTWIAASSGMQIDLNGVTYGNGLFVAVGGTNIFTSPHGLVWKSQSVDINAELYSAAFADGKFLAGDSGTILTSTNGTIWTTQDMGANTASVRGITHGNGTFAAV